MIYCFECYEDDGGCSHQFEIQASRDEVSDLNPRCPNCRKIKSVGRNFGGEGVGMQMAAPQTLGALADRNADRLSDEQKAEMIRKQNEYRFDRPGQELPDNMSYGYDLDTTQLKSDPTKLTKKKPKKRRKKKKD